MLAYTYEENGKFVLKEKESSLFFEEYLPERERKTNAAK